MWGQHWRRQKSLNQPIHGHPRRFTNDNQRAHWRASSFIRDSQNLSGVTTVGVMQPAEPWDGVHTPFGFSIALFRAITFQPKMRS